MSICFHDQAKEMWNCILSILFLQHSAENPIQLIQLMKDTLPGSQVSINEKICVCGAPLISWQHIHDVSCIMPSDPGVGSGYTIILSRIKQLLKQYLVHNYTKLHCVIKYVLKEKIKDYNNLNSVYQTYKENKLFNVKETWWNLKLSFEKKNTHLLISLDRRSTHFTCPVSKENANTDACWAKITAQSHLTCFTYTSVPPGHWSILHGYVTP